MISQQIVIGLLVTFTIYDALVRWTMNRRIKRLEEFIEREFYESP